LVELEGHTLPGLIADFHDSRFASLPPRNWLHDRFHGRIQRPKRVERQFQTAFDDVRARLFPT
jgi:hypothetical protein